MHLVCVTNPLEHLAYTLQGANKEIKATVYGIDVSDTILNKTAAYLAEKDVANFVPVLASDYRKSIPDGIDLVYSICVMQHLSRDLVRRYLANLGEKLRGAGSVHGGGLNKGRIEGLKVQRAMDVHAPAPSGCCYGGL